MKEEGPGEVGRSQDNPVQIAEPGNISKNNPTEWTKLTGDSRSVQVTKVVRKLMSRHSVPSRVTRFGAIH